MVIRLLEWVMKSKLEARILQEVLQMVRTMKMKNPLLLEVLIKIRRPQKTIKTPLRLLTQIQKRISKTRVLSLWLTKKPEVILRSTWILRESPIYVRWSWIEVIKFKAPRSSSLSSRWLIFWAWNWKKIDKFPSSIKIYIENKYFFIEFK